MRVILRHLMICLKHQIVSYYRQNMQSHLYDIYLICAVVYYLLAITLQQQEAGG